MNETWGPAVPAAWRRSSNVSCFAPQCAAVRHFAAEFEADGTEVDIETHPSQLTFSADIVICAASLPLPSLLLSRAAPEAIICDAGSPKNLRPQADMPGARVFLMDSSMWQRRPCS